MIPPGEVLMSIAADSVYSAGQMAVHYSWKAGKTECFPKTSVKSVNRSERCMQCSKIVLRLWISGRLNAAFVGRSEGNWTRNRGTYHRNLAKTNSARPFQQHILRDQQQSASDRTIAERRKPTTRICRFGVPIYAAIKFTLCFTSTKWCTCACVLF